ncbi:MAG: membrane protein insertion efficiency factor YidD [Thermoanaerobaculia bacterium]|nr:membrane protein insertion efficiency factor YidD [Thermoanaerobaculia bacterium]
MTRRRGLAWLAAVLLAGALAADLSREPERQLTAKALLSAIGFYRDAVSPRLARTGVRCRFFPSCSRYAEVSIRSRGAVDGTLRALRRLGRCGPWTRRMTVDPP